MELVKVGETVKYLFENNFSMAFREGRTLKDTGVQITTTGSNME